jgi:hypothetical protein
MGALPQTSASGRYLPLPGPSQKALHASIAFPTHREPRYTGNANYPQFALLGPVQINLRSLQGKVPGCHEGEGDGLRQISLGGLKRGGGHHSQLPIILGLTPQTNSGSGENLAARYL